MAGPVPVKNLLRRARTGQSDAPRLIADSDGTYGVGTDIIGNDLGRFATPREAVALAFRHLPSAAVARTWRRCL